MISERLLSERNACFRIDYGKTTQYAPADAGFNDFGSYDFYSVRCPVGKAAVFKNRLWHYIYLVYRPGYSKLLVWINFDYGVIGKSRLVSNWGVETLNTEFNIFDRIHHLILPAFVLATADMAGLTDTRDPICLMY